VENAELKTPDVSWPLMSTVEVSGTPTGADGFWGAQSSANGLRLIGRAPQGTCAADCGTVKLRPSVQIFGVDAEPRLNGSRIYTVVSENQVRLDDVEEATAETSGGYLSFDPNHYTRLIWFGSNGRNIVLDRCWIHGRGFPSRIVGAIGVSSDDSAVVDSVISEINSWRPVTRQGGSAAAGIHNYFAGAATVLTLGDSSRTEIRNNLFENCIGITVYAETFRSSSTLTPSDLVIARNTFRNDDAYRAGSSTSNGRYYAIRHAIELKRGQRVLIENNLFDGNWADWTPLGPAIGLLTRGAGSSVNNRIQDVTIRSNVFRRVATGIQMLSTDDQIEQPSLPMARIAITNNYFENIDFYQMRSAPSGVGAIAPSSNFGGEVVFLQGALEDLSITRNTAIDNRGRGAAFFWYEGGRSSAVQVTDNVITHNDDFFLGGIPRAARTEYLGFATDGPPSAGFAQVFSNTPDPDPASTFARNLVLPGVRDSSSSASYDDGLPSRNFTKADCEAFYQGFPEIECAGTGNPGETANQRISAVFPNRASPQEPGGRGVDIASIAAVGKNIQSPLATLLATGAMIEFRTSSAESCLVDVAETPDFSSFRRFQDSGGELHSISPDGLTPGQTYYYRIKCASDTQFGEITIPAAP
jgi:hypothetical protein